MVDNSQTNMGGTIQNIPGTFQTIPGNRTFTNNSPPLEQRFQAYDPRPQYASHTVVRGCNPESRWLLVCAQGKERPTTLSQLDICATPSDKELFTELKKAYMALRGKWKHILSLKKIQSIRFVQVKPLKSTAVVNEPITMNSSNSTFEILSISEKSPICLLSPRRTSISTNHTTLSRQLERTSWLISSTIQKMRMKHPSHVCEHQRSER